MRVLAVDTAASSGSVAIVEGVASEHLAGESASKCVMADASVIGEINTGDVGTHSSWLLGAIDTLLKSTGIGKKDIDLFAISTGPGSFTGIRIGVSVIKGLAHTLGRPVVPISTLEAMAMNIPYSAIDICPVLDARKKEVYAAVFRYLPSHSICHGSDKGSDEGRAGGIHHAHRLNGCLERLSEDRVLTPELLVKTLSASASGEDTSKGMLLLGRGAEVYGDYFREHMMDALFAPKYLWRTSGAHIALLALRDYGEKVSALELSPAYLRKGEAEFKRGKRDKKG